MKKLWPLLGGNRILQLDLKKSGGKTGGTNM